MTDVIQVSVRRDPRVHTADIRHRHRHRHHGGVSNKTPPPTELQISATVTTLTKTAINSINWQLYLYCLWTVFRLCVIFIYVWWVACDNYRINENIMMTKIWWIWWWCRHLERRKTLATWGFVRPLKPISHHRLRPDKTVLSKLFCQVGLASVVWTQFATIQNCRRLKISKLNMFGIFSFVGLASAVWTEFATNQNWPPLIAYKHSG